MTITKNVWKAAALLLILCLVSTVMISGTYAKYTSTYAGQDTALVAKWDIIATGGGIKMADTGMNQLDLFSHVYDTNITATGEGGKYIIAPGVAGAFTLEFDNRSDVAADITFDVTKTAISADVPILYSFTSPVGISVGGGTFDAADLASELNTTFAAIDADPTNSTGPVYQTVYWSWPYYVNGPQDVIDTALGTASAISVSNGGIHTSYGLTITAAAVQVAPAQ